MTSKNLLPPLVSRLLGGTALTGVLLLGGAAVAGPVKLTTSSGNASIEGNLLSYEDGIYTVETIIGEINVADDGLICEGEGCPSAEAEAPVEVATEAAAPAADDGGTSGGIPGETVVLTSDNGSVRIEGTLVSYQNGIFTIETVIGTFDVEGDGKLCEGPGCPTTGDGESVVASVSTRLPTIGTAQPEDPAEGDTTAEEPAPQPEPEPEVAEPEPEPEPEPERILPQIQLAAVPADTPAVTIAGPASVLDGLLPALSDLYAAETGGTATALDATLVEAEVAAAAGFPSGRIASLVDGGEGGALAVVGHLTGTGSEAIGSLNASMADIALNATDAPMMLVRNRTEAVLGNEAIIAAVAPGNTLAQLTPQQIADVFSGAVANWSDLGGEDRPIKIFGLPGSHDLTATRDSMLLAPFRVSAREADQIFATEAALAAALATDPDAIGLLSHAAVGEAKALAVGSSCGIATAASAENIRTARYPFSRSLMAVSFAAEGPAAKIIRAVETADDALVRAAGLEPITLARFEMAEDEANLRSALPTIDDRFQRLNAANALRIMPTSERLGTILTFDGRSNRLDTRSKAELERVLEFVGAEGLSEVVIAGHVNGTGDAQADKATARGLAAGVRRALEDADTAGVLGEIVVRAVGIGSVLPHECNDPDAEETLNRRAEIWVRR